MATRACAQRAERPRTGSGGLGLRLLLGLLVAAGVMAAVEGGVRVVGLAPMEEVPALLAFQDLGFPATEPGAVAGTTVFMPASGPTDPRRSVVSASRAPGLRVLVFGGSATYGRSYNPLVSFSGWLQRGLAAVAGRPVEVLNMGVCGWSSTQVKRLLEQAIGTTDPDLVVIYSGNNEFLDRQALRMLAPAVSARMEYLRRPLARSHAYRLLRSLILTVTRPGPVEGPALPIGEGLDVPLTEVDREVAAWIYQRNLEDMVGTARAHAVPILIATVADNQRDWCDGPLPGAFTAQEQEAIDALARAVQNGQPTGIRASIEALPVRVASTEQGAFALGRAWLALGDLAQGRVLLERAELLSHPPYRCNAQLREAARRAGASRGAALCDTAAVLAAGAIQGIPGGDLFYDNCHPNAEGHRRLGRALAGCIAAQRLVDLPGTAAELELALEGAFKPEAADRGGAWRLDHWDTFTGGSEQVPHRSGSAPAEARAGHLAFALGDPAEAAERYRRALELGGPEGPLQLDLGLALQYALDPEGARAALGRAAALLPDDPWVSNFAAVLRVEPSP